MKPSFRTTWIAWVWTLSMVGIPFVCWAEGEQILLKLKDGTDVRVLHTETRDHELAGKVGAFVVQFDRAKIESFTVPAAEKAVAEAESLLAEMEDAQFSDLNSLEAAIQERIRRIKDLHTRLKWLAPGVTSPVKDLEFASARVKEVLADADQTETLLSALNALSESPKGIENTWKKTLHQTESFISAFPFPDKQEEFSRRKQEIVAKRSLHLERLSEPFFQKYDQLDLDSVTQKDYDDFKQLAASVSNPQLVKDSVGMLDRIRMRIPKTDQEQISVDNPTDNPAIASTEPTTTKGPGEGVSSIARLSDKFDPKLVIVGAAALFLIFGMPALMKKLKKGASRSVAPAPQKEPASPTPEPIAEEVSTPVQSTATAAPPDTSTAISASTTEAEGEGGGGERGEEEEIDEHVWMQSDPEEEPVPTIDTLPETTSEDWADTPTEKLNENLIESEPSIEPSLDLEDEVKPSEFLEDDDPLLLEPKVDLDSVFEAAPPDDIQRADNTIEAETEPSIAEGTPDTPERRTMEDLFDALEKTAEAQLKELDQWEEAEDSEELVTSDEAPTPDLTEPEVSLDNVFGFEADISQYLEDTPASSTPESSESAEPDENRTAIASDLREPEVDGTAESSDASDEPVDVESESSSEFEIQIGSGYGSPTESEVGDWDDLDEKVPVDSTADWLEENPGLVNGKHDVSGSMESIEATHSRVPGNAEEETEPLPEPQESGEEGAPEESDDEEVICPITGVFSRSFFDQQFPKTFEKSRRDRFPLTLVLLSIDHFGRIPTDERLEAQSRVLTSVAETLRKSVRARDILARYDESTFAVLMLQVKPTSAFPLALKIRNELKKLVVTTDEGEPMDMTVSFGMNCLMEDDRQMTGEGLLEGCLSSLEKAVDEGGNQIVLHGIEGESQL